MLFSSPTSMVMGINWFGSSKVTTPVATTPPVIAEDEKRAAVILFNDYMGTSFDDLPGSIETIRTTLLSDATVVCDHPFVTRTDTRDALRVIMDGDEERAQKLIDRKAYKYWKGKCPGPRYVMKPADSRAMESEKIKWEKKLTKCELGGLPGDDVLGIAQFFMGKEWADAHPQRMALHAMTGVCSNTPLDVERAAEELKDHFIKHPIDPLLVSANLEILTKSLGKAANALELIRTAVSAAVSVFDSYIAPAGGVPGRSVLDVESRMSQIAGELLCGHPFVTWKDTKPALTVIMGDATRAQLLIDQTAKYYVEGECPPDGIAFPRVSEERIEEILHSLDNCVPVPAGDPPLREGFETFFMGKTWVQYIPVRIAFSKVAGGGYCEPDLPGWKAKVMANVMDPRLVLHGEPHALIGMMFTKAELAPLLERKARALLRNCESRFDCEKFASFVECARAAGSKWHLLRFKKSEKKTSRTDLDLLNFVFTPKAAIRIR